MNIVQIEENVKQLIVRTVLGELEHQDFIYELLLAYGHRSQSVGRIRSGERNLAEDKENAVFWKRQLYFKIAKQQDLHGLIDQMKKEKRTESNKIRFLIVTDFDTFLAVDTKTQDSLDVAFNDLAKKFDFFLPWAGMEKAVYQGENPADVKAAEKLAKLFDEIKVDNFDEDGLNNKDNLHQLNIFLSRLLFCYFAEDTEIFKDKQFTSAISKSKEDGSDLSVLISRLFKVLNQSTEERDVDLPDYLSDFPYVNGGLFKDDIQVPKFTRKSRRILIECGAELDWSDINPDIFGSMFQAVVHTEQRSNMGQHYTSVPNIMKVIEPLFLNDLYEELEKNQDNINRLLLLQQRLGQLKIFDPACGSGNFLIIAYKELRKFEMELLKHVQELELEKTGQFSKPFSVIQVSQFYGIEIDDFAHEVAILSLWLAEHQMNKTFELEFGYCQPILPLRSSGNIICGNATLLDWGKICIKEDDKVVYILGNPPYLGFNAQKPHHTDEIRKVFSHLSSHKYFDYISCWFYKAATYIRLKDSFAFVATNSICQGMQVSILWPHLFKLGLEIGFAHQSFSWSNNAKNNAGVICCIVGLRHINNKRKFLINEYVTNEVSNINAYLVEGKSTIVEKKQKPISKLTPMATGNIPYDGGFLILSNEEKIEILKKYPNASRLIRPFIGSSEYIRGETRWCLWISDNDLQFANSIPEISERISKVAQSRKMGGKIAKNYENVPHRFYMVNTATNSQILVPRVSSIRRDYIPIGYVTPEAIIADSAQAIYDPEPEVFSLITSKMHMIWVRTLAGRLKNDYRYSAILCYNTFPVPKLSEKQRNKLIELGFNIISVREEFPHLTLAELYDPIKMPAQLRAAHIENDSFVESCYKKSGFSNDEQRLEYLINLYVEMTG